MSQGQRLDLTGARALARRHARKGTPLYFFGADEGPWVPDITQVEDVIPSVEDHLITLAGQGRPDEARELLGLLRFLTDSAPHAPAVGVMAH